MGRNDARDQPKRRRPLGLVWLFRAVAGVAGLLIVAAWPVLAVTVAGGALVAERRLVRQRWWWAWTAAALIVGVTAAGGPSDWLVGAVRGPASALFRSVAAAGKVLVQVGVPEQWLSVAGVWAWPQIVVAQLSFAVPAGLLIVAAFNVSRLHGRRLMGQIEGDGYSNVRPAGWLDRRRAARMLACGAGGGLTVYDQPRRPAAKVGGR